MPLTNHLASVDEKAAGHHHLQRTIVLACQAKRLMATGPRTMVRRGKIRGGTRWWGGGAVAELSGGGVQLSWPIYAYHSLARLEHSTTKIPKYPFSAARRPRLCCRIVWTSRRHSETLGSWGTRAVPRGPACGSLGFIASSTGRLPIRPPFCFLLFFFSFCV